MCAESLAYKGDEACPRPLLERWAQGAAGVYAERLAYKGGED